ncbi:MAG: hypothetical protein ACTSXH_05365 [Promethearchaeota archaeon]
MKKKWYENKIFAITDTFSILEEKFVKNLPAENENIFVRSA